MLYTDTDLPPFRGIDPLHPLVEVFDGELHELDKWTRSIADRTCIYRDVREYLAKDPGLGIYVYIFGGDRQRGDDVLYIGVTRNPHTRFAQHRRHGSWWKHATYTFIQHIDCRWHDGPPCSVDELDRAARYLEGWLIELLEPTANRALGPVT